MNSPCDDLEVHFGAEGTLARDSGPFRFRPQQLAYALAVERIIRENGLGMVEAGTGVGKTLGYLIPHILAARRTGTRVLIATKTRNLQDQIFTKDLPRLARSFNFTFAILKGRENYICSERLEEAQADTGLFSSREPYRRALLYLERFNRLHPTGDLEAAQSFLRRYGEDGQRALSAVRATDDTCLPDHRECRYHQALATAEKVDVIVGNHHLALLWPEHYPAISRVVIDEAHALEEAATDIYGACFATSHVQSRLRRLSDRRQRRRGILGRIPARDFVEFKLERVVAAQEALAAPIAAYDEALEAWVRSRGKDRYRILPEDLFDPAWMTLAGSATELLQGLTTLGDALTQAIRDLKPVERLRGVVERLMRSAAAFAEFRLTLERLFSTDPELAARTVLWHDAGRRRATRLWRSPLHVGPDLRAKLFDCHASVTLTSATLQAGGSFDFLAERLGLLEPESDLPNAPLRPYSTRLIDAVGVGHPFDYGRNVLLGLLRSGTKGALPPEEIARHITRLAAITGGRMLALFTNKKRMSATAELIALEGVDVLAQYRDGGRHDLTGALLRRPATVLLGTRSFWEGIDVPGENLSIVVMEKIPFTSPGEPVYEARCEAMGDRWFLRYALPLALLTMRQGFGRLIRSETDRGAVVILSPGSKSYGRRIRATLPECETVEGDAETIAEAIRGFFNKVPST